MISRVAAIIIILFIGLSACKYFFGQHDYIEKSDQFNDSDHQSKEINRLKSSQSYKEGDIIFQISRSRQSKAIQSATGSRYSHCGILFKGSKGRLLVLEAENGVEFTDLETWIRRGDHHSHYVVKRWNDLSAESLIKMKAIGKRFIGRKYDKKFLWNDTELYCSELVWKIYNEGAGIQLGVPQYIKNLPVSTEGRSILEASLKKKLEFHTDPVISPAQIFSCPVLSTLDSTGG